MNATRYLALADVVALHNTIMERTGFPPAAQRSEAGLESAVLRARNAAINEDADLIRQAALLLVGIAQAQAFIDGNKRTAFAAVDVFLRLNGCAYTGAPLDLADLLEQVALADEASRARETDRVEQFLRDTVERLEGRG